jgi:phosphatidylglycerophosphate synthase
VSDLLPTLLFAAVAAVLCVGTVVVLLIRDAVVSVFACDESEDE